MSESRVLTAPRIAWQLRPAAPRPAPPSRAVTTDPRPPSAADCLAELEALARRPFHRTVDTDDDVSSN